MDREEILCKSRAEAVDEGMIFAEQEGRRIGMTAVAAIWILLLLVNVFTDQSNHALLALMWAYIAAEAYAKYRFTRSRYQLAVTWVGVFLAVCFLGLYLVTQFGSYHG